MPRTTTRPKVKQLTPRELIVAEIERRQLTQRPLAAKMGLTPTTMRRALEVDELLTVRRVLEFAQAMDTTATDLLPMLATLGIAKGAIPAAVLDLPVGTLIAVAAEAGVEPNKIVPDLGIV